MLRRYYYISPSKWRLLFGAVLRILSLVFSLTIVCIALALYDISTMEIYTYDSIDSIPHNHVGLVLGTSKYLVKGGLNQFFINRIDAATELYKVGKIDYIVVSGDNAHQNYNEPRQMRKELIARGVPSDHIYLDYAGFRTLDSVLRIRKIFKQHKVTIISQDFQNKRAIYIARHHNIDAIGFNAKKVDSSFTGTIREFFARIKCVFDVYVFNSSPKFLGDEIEIGNKNIDPKHAQFLNEEPNNKQGLPAHIPQSKPTKQSNP